MNILICADIEGIAGVHDPMQTRRGNSEYDHAIELMTAEVNAAIRGAFTGGASEVYVVDAHCDFRNLSIDQLNPRARLISGKPRQLGMLAGLEIGINQVFFIGFHAAANRFGTLSHTINERAFAEIKINNVTAGEAELYGLMAGEYNAAVGLITGDDCLINDVTKLFSNAETVVTKRTYLGSQRVAIHTAPAIVLAEIEKAADSAVSEQRNAFTVNDKIEIEVTTTHVFFADLFSILPLLKRTGPKTLVFSADNVTYAVRTLNALSAMSWSVPD